jgi:hypothetical protein
MMTQTTINKFIFIAIQLFIISLFILTINGCITSMSGKQAIGGETGIRYYLPAPHLIVTPKPDGTASIEIKYFPDPNNAYTLNLESFFASATFEVKLTDGMLTSLNLDAKADNIPSEALKTAGELKKKQVDKDNAEDKKKKDKKDENAKAAEKDAEEIRTKENELKTAMEELKFYESHPGTISDNDLLKIKWKIKELELQVEFLKEKANKSDGSALNDPTQVYIPNLAMAYGPVIFRILPANNGGVKLVALDKQETFTTSVEPPEKKPPEEIRFTPSPVVIKKDDQDKDILLTFTVPIESIDSTRIRLTNPSLGVKAPPVLSGDREIAFSIISADRKNIKIVMLKDPKPGHYLLDLFIVFIVPEGKKQTAMITVEISWKLT